MSFFHDIDLKVDSHDANVFGVVLALFAVVANGLLWKVWAVLSLLHRPRTLYAAFMQCVRGLVQLS